MKFLEKIAILFFDLIDKFFHQKKILNQLKKNISNMDIYIDVGSHKGSYVDLIYKNFNLKKILKINIKMIILKY